jgi:hypothetical protein
MMKSSVLVLIVATILLIYVKDFVPYGSKNKQSVPCLQKEFIAASTPTPVPMELHVFYYDVRNSANAAEKKFKLIMAPNPVEQNRTA